MEAILSTITIKKYIYIIIILDIKIQKIYIVHLPSKDEFVDVFYI